MPSLSALIVSACLSGCVVGGHFVLADASARTQLQQAVITSRTPRIDRKPVAALSRAKVTPLDRQRLRATIAIISHPDAE